MLPTTTFAHGELWYDAKSYLPKWKKITVYPIKWMNSDFLIDTNGQSDIYQANNYFEKRFVRKLKITTIPLGVPSEDNKKFVKTMQNINRFMLIFLLKRIEQTKSQKLPEQTVMHFHTYISTKQSRISLPQKLSRFK